MSNLRVGAAEVDITPLLGCSMSGSFTERRAADVISPLKSKAVVFDDGDTQIAYVQNDLLFMVIADLDRAKRRATELTGIPPGNMMLSCTHTHYGPSAAPIFTQPVDRGYVDWAVLRMGDAVKLAQNRLAPARIAHGSGACPEETHNRRWWMKDGSVRMNPPLASPELDRPAGPTDPEVALLVAERLDGTPIAAIANYSLHYVGGTGLAISADYFAAFAAALQRMAGAEFVAIMANGCCGDVNNVVRTEPRTPDPHPGYRVEKVGSVLAAEAYRIWRLLDGDDRTSEATVGAAAAFPTYRRRTAEEEEARIVAGGQTAVEQIPENRAACYARDRAAVDELPLEMETEVQALRIGDLAMVGLPGEIFVEYGLAIKAASPFARTMTIELANDWIGYVPTDRALDEGGYETWLAMSAKVAKGIEGCLIAAARDCLKRVGAH